MNLTRISVKVFKEEYEQLREILERKAMNFSKWLRLKIREEIDNETNNKNGYKKSKRK